MWRATQANKKKHVGLEAWLAEKATEAFAQLKFYSQLSFFLFLTNTV